MDNSLFEVNQHSINEAILFTFLLTNPFLSIVHLVEVTKPIFSEEGLINTNSYIYKNMTLFLLCGQFWRTKIKLDSFMIVRSEK
jgi:hypothetical protein